MHAAALLLVLTACGSAASSGEATSPGPGRIAFAVNRDGFNEIWTMRTDGTSRRRLTRRGPAVSDESGNQEPSWAPSGSFIAYTSSGAHLRERMADLEIYRMRADGRQKRRLTFNRVTDLQPSWSPDGARIAFARESAGPRPYSAIYTMNANGSDQRELARESPDRGAVFLLTPTWSPDGTKIAYTRYAFQDGLELAIYVIDSDGSDRRRLVDDAADPAWSPDGSRIALLTDRDHNGRCLFHDCQGFASEIYVARADGSDAGRVTHTRAVEATPTWSPDGSRIAFARIASEKTGYQIYSIHPDGTGLRQLTRSRATTAWKYQPAWGTR